MILHKLTYEIQFSNRRSSLRLKRNKVNEINDFKPPTNHSSSNISVKNCIELKNEDGYSHDFSYLFPPRSMSRKQAQKNVYGINFNFIYIFQTGNMFFPSAYELILFHIRASIPLCYFTEWHKYDL